MSKTQTIRILIADDHTVVREGLTAILQRIPGVSVEGLESNWPKAIAAVEQHSPDVAVLDVRMPGMAAAEGVAILRRKYPDLRIVLMSAFDCDEDIYGVIRAGANGFMVKNCSPREIVACLHAVMEGKRWLAAGPEAKLLETMHAPELTPRQIQILELVTEGKTNKEVGAALKITEGTVKVQLNHIFRKMGVANRTEAITKGLQRGLVQTRTYA
ncbi:MAG: response regulator [Terracidiphilus sp.]